MGCNFGFDREPCCVYKIRIFYTLCGLGSTEENKDGFGKVK